MNGKARDRELPPGPPRNMILGAFLNIRRRPLEFLTEQARMYGDAVFMRIGKIRLYMFSHPDMIEQVLVTDNRHFAKPWLLRRAAEVLGNGLLTSDGDFWKRQRHLMQPAFHRSRVAAYGEVMVRRTEAMMHIWQDGQVLDVHAEMMRLTLGIVAETLFGAEVESRAATVSNALELSLQRFVDQLSPLRLLDRLPLPRNFRFRKAIGELDGIIYEIIERRRAGRAVRNDLLAMLLEARDEHAEGMTDRQLRDEVVTLFLAGHETTAIALSWTWYLLSENPEVRARLLEEIDSVLGDRAPTVADLPALKYTELVVRESMRLYPPAWRVGRDVVEECTVGGYRLPVGAQVLLCQWIVQRDPRFFIDPLAFRPERWTELNADSIPRFAYFPFSAGARRCIGDFFAQMEAILVLATICRSYTLDLVPQPPVTPFPSITLRPRHGLRVRMNHRKP